MAAPIRTCIGCRKIWPAGELVRLVLVDGRVQPWTRQRPGGRGASIHPTESCVKAALRGGAWSRAFRRRFDDLSHLEPDSLLPLLTAATIRKTTP
jgi:predicted RNA-binding protein YlxR (DUF448 family)